MDWHKVAPDFEPDGGLRDIYVLGADLSDWQNVMDGLRGFEPPPGFWMNGEKAIIPTKVVEIFAARASGSPMLQLSLGKINLNCHFFGSEDMEFDLDPREVEGQAELDAVEAFMRFLGHITGKAVVLTPENLRDAPILRWLPHTDEMESGCRRHDGKR